MLPRDDLTFGTQKVIAGGFVAIGKFDEANLASNVTRNIATRLISETSF
jgi:hypothetical protein